MHFLVLGAGLSGLSCGISLLEAGHDVTILEKEQSAGGLCRSFRKDGFTFDYGPHFLFGQEIRNVLKERITSSFEVPLIKRNGERIVAQNRLFQFPFEPKNILKIMGITHALPVLIDIVVANIFRKSKPVTNLEEWIINTVGEKIYNYICLSGYVQKLYGLTPRDVSPKWGEQKLKFLSRWRNNSLLVLGLRALKEGKQLQKQVVSYPPSGIDAIPAKLKERYVELGGKILFSSPVVSIKEKLGYVEVDTLDNQSFSGEYLLSSIPITEMLNNGPLNTAKINTDILSRLAHRKTVFFLLHFNTSRVTDYQCLYFTGQDYVFRRVTEFKNLSPLMSPFDKSSLCVEITCNENEEIDTSPDMVKTILEQLDKSGHFKIKDYSHYYTLNASNTYPVYTIDYVDIMKNILTYLKGYKRVISFGRQGLFFYNTMSNSIIQGYSLGSSFKDNFDFSSVKQNYYDNHVRLFN
jgi:protoporphyrinogen oxidase